VWVPRLAGLSLGIHAFARGNMAGAGERDRKRVVPHTQDPPWRILRESMGPALSRPNTWNLRAQLQWMPSWTAVLGALSHPTTPPKAPYDGHFS